MVDVFFGCWTHMKRKWREAMSKSTIVKTSKAAVGYQYCNKLFAREKKCADFQYIILLGGGADRL